MVYYFCVQLNHLDRLVTQKMFSMIQVAQNILLQSDSKWCLDQCFPEIWDLYFIFMARDTFNCILFEI
jgi:hypothetical protein